MNARPLWFVSLTLTFLCGCGRQGAQPTAPPTPPVQVDTVPRDSRAGGQRPAEGATDPGRPPAAALAEFRAILDRAFEALRKQGIVAEPKFEDCARCAVAAMSDLLQERSAPGGVYWHDQDDENLERGEDLNIGFVGREDRNAVAIAQKLVAALKAEGLTVEWDGSVDTRVTVKPPRTKHETAADQPRVRLERVGHIPGEVGDPIPDLVVAGRYAYVTQHDQLRVIDVLKPTRPSVVGTLDFKGGATVLSVSGRYAYVASEGRLQFVDVSDPVAPRVALSCDLGFAFGNVAVQGKYAYATDGESVRVLDVSNPAAPKEVGRCAVECGEAITVAGQHAYLSCDVKGVRVVDIADPAAPRQVGAWNGPANAMQTTVAGKHAFVTGGEDGVGLWIADVSDPKAPKTVARYGDGLTGGVAVQDNYAYLAGGHLDVLDISNPAVPKLVGYYRDDECMTAWRVAVVGDFVYVTGEGNVGFSVLRAVWVGKEVLLR